MCRRSRRPRSRSEGLPSPLLSLRLFEFASELCRMHAQHRYVENVTFLKGEIPIGHPGNAKAAYRNHAALALDVEFNRAAPDQPWGGRERCDYDLAVIQRVLHGGLV